MFKIHTADWSIEKVENGFLMKNLQYQEYLYGASDNLAFDENSRSVFTWKTLETLAINGIWNFNAVSSGNLLCLNF